MVEYMTNDASALAHPQMEKPGSEDMKYLFVVTYGRSGSTVLLNLLNRIDGYCIRGENHGITNHLAQAWCVVAKARADYGNEASDPSTPWFGIDRVDAEAFGSFLADSFCNSVLQPDVGTRVVGFKEVRYSPHDVTDHEYDSMIAFLSENFEGSRFIFNTRDWNEVANSGWWKQFWSKRRVRRIIEHSNLRFQRSINMLEERAFAIDYADYRKNPAGFDPLLRWLGEDVAQEVVEQVVFTKLNHAVKKFRPRGLKSRLKKITRWVF